MFNHRKQINLEVKELAIHFIISEIDRLLEGSNLLDQIYLTQRKEINLKKLEICTMLLKK